MYLVAISSLGLDLFTDSYELQQQERRLEVQGLESIIFLVMLFY